MRQLVESLKRLYYNKRITQDKVMEMYNSKTITADEKDYILG